jgi:sulfate adenylyltransferase subunit 2
VTKYALDHLEILEAESIYIMREVAAQFRNPVLLFSGGKDSIVMTRIAEKAFRPGKFPFPMMLIDTGHNFPETLDFIRRRTQQLNERFIVESVQTSIDQGRAREEKGAYASRNRLQSVTLMDAIRNHKFDAVIGGARRDEEKARAKERIFSIRDDFGQWDPKNQRPEVWNLFNGHMDSHEHMRVFPLSNWTELDVWQYIQKEELDLPSIYFSHRRMCVKNANMLLAMSEFIHPREEDIVEEMQVRFRTVGDMTCTGAFLSGASNVAEIIEEICTTRITERGSRLDDKKSDSAMEDRKKEGYF